MVLSSDQLNALLKSLGLVGSLLKPVPDIVGAITDPLQGPLNGVVSAVDGIGGLLGLPPLESLPLIGGILLAEHPNMKITDPYKSLSVLSQEVLNAENITCFVQSYDPPPVLSQTFPPFDKAKANIFRYRQQQAVNLGSWFVHEQWMTPSLFTCASGPQQAEIDIASGWNGTSHAKALLENHWDTFITQKDFQYLASIGINSIRLPIGYWSLGPLYCQGTPFEPYSDVYENSWSRVMRAISWAGESGMGVLVDLHGAPGSQNGQPHSGVSDGQQTLFGNKTNEDATVDVLSFLTQQLASVTNVIGIQVLNEPVDDPSLPDFYTRALDSMRQASPEAANLPMYIHDGFNLQQFSEFIASREDFVVEDHHSYFVFNANDTENSVTADTKEVDTSVFDQLKSASKRERRNLVVGEWSCALSQNSLAGQKDPQGSRKEFCTGQQVSYANSTAGSFFWSYNMENCDSDLDWCFKSAVGSSLPSTFFSYNSTGTPTPNKALFIAHSVANLDLPSMDEVLDQAASSSSSDTPAATSTDSTSVSSDYASSTTSATDSSETSTSADLKRDLPQRFLSIHSRRSLHSDMTRHHIKRDSSSLPATLANLTATERSITKGYSDGFLTAKIFAQYGMSRLGFTGQYIQDSLAAINSSIVAPGTEGEYTAWFNNGLKDAERMIGTAVNA